MNIKVDTEHYACEPIRAHEDDAGIDLVAPCVGDHVIRAHTKYTVDTHVHFEIPKGYVGLVLPRSGLSTKYGITLANCIGVIDCGYTGSVRVVLENTSDDDYTLLGGERIAQMVIVPCLIEELDIVDNLQETDRGNGGFGSTGR